MKGEAGAALIDVSSACGVEARAHAPGPVRSHHRGRGGIAKAVFQHRGILVSERPGKP